MRFSTGTFTSSKKTSLTSWLPSMVWIGRTVLRACGPGLLAVDDVEVALALRAGLERGQVRTRAGLGKALAPPVVEIGDARQVFLLLVLAAERDDHGPDHHGAERQWFGGRGLLQLLLEDVELHRAPARAAMFLGPVRHRPALLVQDALPGDDVVLDVADALRGLLADAVRQVLLEECTH